MRFFNKVLCKTRCVAVIVKTCLMFFVSCGEPSTNPSDIHLVACMCIYISIFYLPVYMSSFIVTCINIGSNVVNVCWFMNSFV